MKRIPTVVIPHSAARRGAASCMTRQIRLGLAGMSTWLTPYDESASTTAFITAAGDPMVPTSPQPLTPMGVCAQNVLWVSIDMVERLSARGMQ